MNIRIYVMEILSSIIQGWRIRSAKFKGYVNIHPSAILESNLLLDKVFPQGIYIGENSLIAAGSTILTHEHVKRVKDNPRMPYTVNTYIGRNCFIGIKAIILPGVRIGDEVIVGAGTVVTKDIPSNSVVVGNPGRVLDRKVNLSAKAVLGEFNY